MKHRHTHKVAVVEVCVYVCVYKCVWVIGGMRVCQVSKRVSFKSSVSSGEDRLVLTESAK